MQKVLITGAKGFFGTRVLDEFEKNGYITIGTDIAAFSTQQNYFCADITSREQLNETVPEITCLIHVAGLAHIFNPKPDTDSLFKKINVLGTRNIVEIAALRGVKHVVFISSVSVYKKKLGLVSESDEIEPLSTYAKSKFEAEQLAIELAKKYGFKLTILRPATLFGEGDPGNVSRLIRQIKSKWFFMVGKGLNFKSLLHVKDAARACRLAFEKQTAQIEIFNVADEPRRMIEIINVIRHQLKRKPVHWHVPLEPIFFLARFLQFFPWLDSKVSRLDGTLRKFVEDDAYSAEKFKKELGFVVQEDFQAAIAEEIDSIC